MTAPIGKPVRVDPQREWSRLLSFYDPAVVDPSGGFHWLDDDGAPLERASRELWLTARFTYCYALAELAGHPGAAGRVEHGLSALEDVFFDARNGGWCASTARGARKESYSHAHVLLAAAAAVRARHPRARSTLDRALDASARFVDAAGLYADTFAADWSDAEAYRGANANMHMTEALLAAGAATGDHAITRRACDVLDAIVGQHAAAHGWRVPEHFDAQWRVLPEFNRDNPRNPFRPFGSAVGHWFEWARLSLQAWAATGRADDRHVERAVRLFEIAMREGLDASDRFVFTIDLDGEIADRDRYHWVVTEAIGAAEALASATGARGYREDAAHFWNVAARDFIDLERGSWVHQTDERGVPVTTVWTGKPDLYHTLQACLYGRVPLSSDLATALVG